MIEYLPDILEIAESNGITRYRNGKPGQDVRFNCPWCVSIVGKPDKDGKLWISPKKKTFKCWRCGEQGGVIDLLVKLTGKSKIEINQDLREKFAQQFGTTQKPKKKAGWENHPAMKLDSYQWRAMGFTGKVTHQEFRRDPELARKTLQWAWREWQMFVQEQVREVFGMVVMAYYSNNFEPYREQVSELEKSFGIENLWGQAEKLFIMPCRFWPEWAIKKERFALEMLVGDDSLGDYSAWIQYRKSACRCTQAHNGADCKRREIEALKIRLRGSRKTSGQQQVPSNGYVRQQAI